MPLKDLLSRGRIAVLDTGAGDRDAVLDAAARLLAGDGDAAMPIAECLRQRERLGSTAIGHGVAIPHGRCSAFEEARAAFLRLSSPVDFGAVDGEPVDLVFAMAVPQHFTQQHLQLLSELAEHFADAGFRAALREAADADALAAVLQRGRGP
jgi:PTS system nitrogen regulatory IIA component